MAVNGTSTGQLVGMVSSVNPKGIKLDGQADWLNFSKFATDLVPPPRGARVAVTLDGQGFVRAIAPANGEAQNFAPPLDGPSEDTLIVRQTCIKAAAEFCASRPELKSSDALRIAESWEAWVTR